MWRFKTFLRQVVTEGIECVPLSAAARSCVPAAVEAAVTHNSSSLMTEESAAAVQGFTERRPYM